MVPSSILAFFYIIARRFRLLAPNFGGILEVLGLGLGLGEWEVGSWNILYQREIKLEGLVACHLIKVMLT
jgi:hypothetical protein